jgi:hypothetical protein
MAKTAMDDRNGSLLVSRGHASRPRTCAFVVGVFLAAIPVVATAQQQPPPDTAIPPAEAPPPAVAAPPPPEAPPPVMVAAPPPPPSPAAVYDPKALSVGAWLRVGGRIQNPSQRDKLNDVWMDEIYVILSARGQINNWFKWQFNLNANVPPTTYTPPPNAYPSVGVQDLIVKIEPHDLFNVWAGRMLVPVDRSNLSGPWFINFFLYPGFYRVRSAPPPIGLKTGPNGRDDGINVWGQIGKGQVKYYLGAFNLDGQQSQISPLYTVRLNINLLDPEPGYYHQSAYHGDKDIIAIGGGLQYQKNGSARPIPPAMMGDPTTYDIGDLKVFTGDLLIDKKLGAAGVGTLEGAAYFYDQRQPVRQFYMFDGAYVLPMPIGPGRIQPSVRYQFTKEPGVKMVDGYISYLVKSHFAKFFLGYYWADMGTMGGKQQAIQMGIQIIKL